MQSEKLNQIAAMREKLRSPHFAATKEFSRWAVKNQDAIMFASKAEIQTPTFPHVKYCPSCGGGKVREHGPDEKVLTILYDCRDCGCHFQTAGAW